MGSFLIYFDGGTNTSGQRDLHGGRKSIIFHGFKNKSLICFLITKETGISGKKWNITEIYMT